MRRLIFKIYKEDGISGFYKGLFQQMLGCLVAFSVYFYWYQYFRVKFVRSKDDHLGNLKASLLAGVICSISTNPYWVAMTKYQTSKKEASDDKQKTFL